MSRKPRCVLALALAAAACGDPSLSEYEPRTGIITGTILYQRPSGSGICGSDLTGNVIVTLFEADALPPPEGTSGPVNFIVVPASALFDGRTDDGVFTAPFTMPTVAPGRYQIRAFLDADADFHPTIDLLSQVTGGDVGGGHVDPATGEFLEIEVRADEETAQVTVSVGRVIPTERPAFAHTSTTTFTVPYATPQPLVLTSRALTRPNLDMDPSCTRFLVQYADLDDDGAPDDVNGDHLPDLFPQVLLRLVQEDPAALPILIPGIIDPLPFRDRLEQVPAVPTSSVTVLLPPVAVRVEADGQRTVLEDIPPGRYETIVIQSTGQTWQVPNGVDQLIPEGGPDPSQSVLVEMVAGPARPAGGITGTVRVDSAAGGDVFVVAFDAADPPPPAGTGTPIALATVPSAAFEGAGAGRTAPFALTGLRDGSYQIVALLDADGDFSPVVPLLSQASAGDVLGGAAQPGGVQGGLTEGVTVVVSEPVPVDRPAFAFAPTSLARTDFPAELLLEARPVPALGVDAPRVPITLAGGDQEGDNFVDLRPRVLVTRMVDEGDPRTAPDDPRGVVIPALVEPLPFYGPLLAGAQAVPADAYRIILPPVAVSLATGERLAPPPAGRYRINVLSATGQTWSVPNAVDVALARVGGPLADPTQARALVVEDTPLPRGAIQGEVRLTFEPPETDFSVVVLAFAAADPPPPNGGGSPVATSVLSADDFGDADTAPYVLGPLATGAYVVRAFLDADDDFTPWYDPLNQPDRGDVGGGVVDEMGRPVVIDVDASAGPAGPATVVIAAPAMLPVDRPAFELPAPEPVLELRTGSVAVSLTALVEATDVATMQGVFPVQWVDLNGDGRADDVNQDGNPDVYPIVVADRLDPDDPEGLTLASPGVRIPGLVDPRQVAVLGFPAGDPTDTAALVTTNSLTVVFPALARQDGLPEPIAPPPGRYRITLVNGFGQTWSVPNVLSRATGTPFVASQSRALTVSE